MGRFHFCDDLVGIFEKYDGNTVLTDYSPPPLRPHGNWENESRGVTSGLKMYTLICLGLFLGLKLCVLRYFVMFSL